MQTRLSTDWLLSVGEESAADVQITIFYGDVEAGHRAVRSLARMGHTLEELKRTPRLWRFDLLEDPDWFAKAAEEGAEADIIVIATSSCGELDSAVVNCLKECFRKKGGRTAAIVALFGPANTLDNPSSPRLRLVQSLAEEAKLDFFAPQFALQMFTSRRAPGEPPAESGRTGF